MEARQLPSSHRDGNAQTPAGQLELGTVVLGKYLVSTELGRGAFATVYGARHLGLCREVAIKVMRHDSATDRQELAARFEREVRIASQVKHPRLVEVLELGRLVDGTPFLVMERLQGVTLAQRIEQGPLPIPECIELGEQLLEALAALDQAQVVHRDVKPSNIMLRSGGRLDLTLLDFGIAQPVVREGSLTLTQNGAPIGTPHYTSPEQLRSERVDARADLYAAGVVLYEAITGKVPFHAANWTLFVLNVLRGQAPSPRSLRADCPRWLERLVLRAIARSPDARYPTAEAMRRDLRCRRASRVRSQPWLRETRVALLTALLRRVQARSLMLASLAGWLLMAGPNPPGQTRLAREQTSATSTSPAHDRPSRVHLGFQAAPLRWRPDAQKVDRSPQAVSPSLSPTASDEGAGAPADSDAAAGPSESSQHLSREGARALSSGELDAARSYFLRALDQERSDATALRGMFSLAIRQRRRKEAAHYLARYRSAHRRAADLDDLDARFAAMKR